MPVIPDTYTTLSAMITPALFMTANGSLIISTSNRMSRIVDRIRQLNLEADELCRGTSRLDFVDDRLEHVTVQLSRMTTRSDLIRLALTLLYLAMAMYVGTSLTMAVDALLGNNLVVVPTTLAIVGVSLMLAACVQLLGPMTSRYRWEGAVEVNEEWLGLVKTTAAQCDAVMARIVALHPYDVPEVVVTPVTGLGSYLAWIDDAVE